VPASGSSSEKSQCTRYTTVLSESWFIDSCISLETARGEGGFRVRVEQTDMVGAHLESLVAAHQEPDLAGSLVLEQLDIADTALLPLWSGIALAPLEQLRSPVGSYIRSP
jgi:hypothetical protein